MASRKAKASESPAVEESIVAQIIGQLMGRTERSKEFDTDTLLKLKRLGVKGMTKHKLVSEAIAVQREQT